MAIYSNPKEIDPGKLMALVTCCVFFTDRIRRRISCRPAMG